MKYLSEENQSSHTLLEMYPESLLDVVWRIKTAASNIFWVDHLGRHM